MANCTIPPTCKANDSRLFELYTPLQREEEEKNSETYHKGILCFFSIGSQYDHRVSNRVNYPTHESYSKGCQLEVLLPYPNVYFPLVFSFHEVNTCNLKLTLFKVMKNSDIQRKFQLISIKHLNQISKPNQFLAKVIPNT